MPNEKEWSLEQIEAHLQNADIDQFQEYGEAGAAAVNPAALLSRVCGAYRAIKPILRVILNFPLIPSSIKNAIRTFMSILDTLCP